MVHVFCLWILQAARCEQLAQTVPPSLRLVYCCTDGNTITLAAVVMGFLCWNLTGCSLFDTHWKEIRGEHCDAVFLVAASCFYLNIDICDLWH